MNKRVVTFLSLFSLVMVLSIYYVMLPSGVKTPDQSQQVGNVINNADDPYIEGIILERKTNQNSELETQLNIMASSEYSATEKVLAAEKIEQIEQLIDIESEMRTSIKELGFASCYVEVNVSDVEVLAISESKTSNEAIKIIECVDSFFADDDFHQVKVYFR